MSRSIAKFLHRVAAVVTAPQSPRRKAMTISRLMERLEADAAHNITTRHGVIKSLPLRGPHLAAAAVGFDDEEPETLLWMDGFHSGDVFYDVGAATGLFSMYAALRPGVIVYAFEPKGTSFGVLIEHLAINKMGDRIFPLCLALSDVTEATHLSLSSLAAGSGGNSVGGAPDQFGLTHSVFNQGALAYRLDDLVTQFGLPAPTHLKIDVDGAEGAILGGAPLALQTIKSLMIEVEGRNAEEADVRLLHHIKAAGLVEDQSVRGAGSGRNRLYRRA